MENLKKVFTSGFWRSNNQKDIEAKFYIAGFLIVALVSIFSYTLYKMVDNRWNRRADKIHAKYEKKTNELNKDLDSAEAAGKVISYRVYTLEERLRQDSTRQSKLNNNLQKDLNEIKEIQGNEKKYVPSNTPFDEQLRHISTVKYRPIDSRD